MKATFRNVIIKEIIEDAISNGGIILGNTKDVKFKKGIVQAIGDEVKNVIEGDIVHYDGYRASRIDLDGDYLFVCQYEDIVIVE